MGVRLSFNRQLFRMWRILSMNTSWSRLIAGTSSSKNGYVWALVFCSALTVAAIPLIGHLDLANIVMLFLLAVVLVAMHFGRGPAVLAAFLSVALFDFFFVPPRLSFTVNNIQYLVTFAVMLAVALVIGQLAAGLRRQADLASLKEQQTRALYEPERCMKWRVTWLVH